MMCAWDALLEIVPRQMRNSVDQFGRENLQELRLRQGMSPELVCGNGSKWLDTVCKCEDIRFCIQAARRYSPWREESVCSGFLTAPGGHRVGLCGLSLYHNGRMRAMGKITSLCIRVARDYPGIGADAPDEGSVLILGAPGWGKTTLLRDLIRQRSRHTQIAVVDERGELFPDGFERGKRTDILQGCRKEQGMEQVLKTMGPGCIALDEITAAEDCAGMLRACGCGVSILATAHASSLQEFKSRPLYQPLLERKIFQWVLVMHPDKSYHAERMENQ